MKDLLWSKKQPIKFILQKQLIDITLNSTTELELEPKKKGLNQQTIEDVPWFSSEKIWQLHTWMLHV